MRSRGSRKGTSVALAGALSFTLLSGCATDDLTQIVLETDTDFVIGAELARIEWQIVSAGGAVEPSPSIDLTPDDASSFPLYLTLVPGTAPDTAIEITATGFAPDGEALVTQTLRTAFAPGVSATVRIDLSRLCVGFECPESESCRIVDRVATCTSTEVDPSALPAFREGRPAGQTELCNGRDDDGDGEIDNGFALGSDTSHCGGCYLSCPEVTGGAPTCDDASCGYVCDAGRADCNDDAVDGCETDLTQIGTCGACDVACEEPARLCETTGDVSACVDRCAEGLSVCDAERCVDLAASVADCGECGNACVDPGANGTVTCEAGECASVCEDGFHLCDDDGQCESDTSVDDCGPLCLECDDSGANVESVACIDDACVPVCATGTADCDGDLANGCESVLDEDDANCGECGVDCGYGTCSTGRCSNQVQYFVVGPRHACAALADQTFWCWGANDAGQLGSGTSSLGEAIPVQMRNAPAVDTSGVRRLTGADNLTTYFTTSTCVPMGPCFAGLEAMGRLPSADPDDVRFANSPTNVMALNDGYVTIGGDGVLAAVRSLLTGNQELLGVGSTAYSAFSTWVDPEPESQRVARTTLIDMLEIPEDRMSDRMFARDARVSCADLGGASTRQLYCWGVSGDGRDALIGDGSREGSVSPVVIQPGARRRFSPDGGGVTLGPGVGCAAFVSTALPPEPANLYCWGDWECGTYGLSPTRVPGVVAAQLPDLSLAESSACAVDAGTDELICWGRDLLGGCLDAPTTMFDAAGVSSVELGHDFGCYLRRVTGGSGGGRALFCWGANDVGQLGRGTTEGPREPAPVVFSTRPL